MSEKRDVTLRDVRDVVVWAAAPGFGGFLRNKRNAAGLPLQLASEVMGTSYSYLGRLERGEVVTPPTLRFLASVAFTYRCPLDQVAAAAGIPIDERWKRLAADPSKAQVRFRRLVKHFKPIGLKDPGPMYYSPYHKDWAVELVRAVERRALERPDLPPLRAALSTGLEGARTDEERRELRDSSTGFMAWGGDPGFGPALKKRRTDAGISLRQAGRLFGGSHAQVARMERTARQRPPTRKLMEKIATAYGLELFDVMSMAGFRSGVPLNVMLGADVHELFQRLLFDLGLRPEGMEERDLTLFSDLQKQQMIDLAEQTDETVRIHGACIERILESDGPFPPDEG